jgi:glycosyltransferase involved in cell wall biosynthesis
VDFVWHSGPPWYRTGFGQQAGMVLNSLAALDYRFVVSSPEPPQEGLAGVPHLPSPELSGRDLARNTHAAFSGASSRPRAIAFVNSERIADDLCEDLDLVLWLPFNFSPPPRRLRSYIASRGPTQVLALTNWAQSSLKENGIESTYMPHGVDRSVFTPAPDRGIVMRERLGLDRGAFVAGFVGANNEWFGNRKSLPEILAAFSAFAATHADAYLYLHTDMSGRLLGEGLDVLAIAEQFAPLSGRLLYTSPAEYERGWSRSEIADLYRAMDVLVAPSAGEGFGIPVIEAQACGIPVIVSNWATQAELVGSGWGVGGQPRWAHWVGSWQFTPDIQDLVSAMERAYAGPRPPLADAVRFTDPYDHEEVIVRHWTPFLEGWLGRQ